MGGFCDPFSPDYDPLLCGEVGGVPFRPGPGSGSTDVTIINVPPPVVVPINIEVPLSLGTTIATAIAGVVTGTLTTQSKEVQSVWKALGTVLTGAITGLLNNIGSFQTKLLDGLSDGIKRLKDSITAVLASIVTAIGTTIYGALKDIKGVLGDLKDAIKTKFDDLVSAVKAGGAAAIIPVLTAILTEIRNIQNIVAAIQNAARSGAAGALQVAGAVIGGIASLDA